MSAGPGGWASAGSGHDEDRLVWSPRQPPDDGRRAWPPERRPRGGRQRASTGETADPRADRARWEAGEPGNVPTDDASPETSSEDPTGGSGAGFAGGLPNAGERSGWVSEGPGDDDRQEWTSEEFRGEEIHRPWALWRRGRGGRRGGRALERVRRDDERIWPEESVWETHRPWPLTDDSTQDELPPSARWYGAPAAPPPRRAAGRLRSLLAGLIATVVGLSIGFGVAVLVPPLLLRQVPQQERVSTVGPGRVNDPAAGVGYPLPAGWRAGGAPAVTGFTSMASGDGVVTVMTRPADPVTDVRKATAELADLYGRLLLHGDEIKVVDDRTVTVGRRTGHSRSLRAEYRDVVNRPAYLRLVFLKGPGGRPVVAIGVAQPDDPRLRAAIDTVMAGIR